MQSLEKHSSKPTSREIIKAICKDVDDFTGDAPQHDDMTMVIVKVK
jgi:serine phosphatase RsbU (regulator of sigma subunit)